MLKEFAQTPYAERLRATGVITSYICPLMYMNNPLCAKISVVTPGTVKAEAVVTHTGFHTLASLQKALQFGDKAAKCNDQNNPELFANPIDSLAAAGAILAEVWLDDVKMPVVDSLGEEFLELFSDEYRNNITCNIFSLDDDVNNMITAYGGQVM